MQLAFLNFENYFSDNEVFVDILLVTIHFIFLMGNIYFLMFFTGVKLYFTYLVNRVLLLLTAFFTFDGKSIILLYFWHINIDINPFMACDLDKCRLDL